MATATRSRKVLQPVSGICRWLVRPSSPCDGGTLDINGVAYDVHVLWNETETAVVGYRLIKADATMYDIDSATPHGWTCDCPDATYRSERPGGCKHSRALQAALKALAN
jgi:hypothetical protein